MGVGCFFPKQRKSLPGTVTRAVTHNPGADHLGAITRAPFLTEELTISELSLFSEADLSEDLSLHRGSPSEAFPYSPAADDSAGLPGRVLGDVE